MNHGERLFEKEQGAPREGGEGAVARGGTQFIFRFTFRQGEERNRSRFCSSRVSRLSCIVSHVLFFSTACVSVDKIPHSSTFNVTFLIEQPAHVQMASYLYKLIPHSLIEPNKQSSNTTILGVFLFYFLTLQWANRKISGSCGCFLHRHVLLNQRWLLPLLTPPEIQSQNHYVLLTRGRNAFFPLFFNTFWPFSSCKRETNQLLYEANEMNV